MEPIDPGGDYELAVLVLMALVVAVGFFFIGYLTRA